MIAPICDRLDVMMPGMDGPSVAAAIRNLDSDRELPVVFLTARALEEDVQHLLTVGSIGVIRKPFDPLTLAERVRELWGRLRAVERPNDPAATDSKPTMMILDRLNGGVPRP